MEAGVLKLRTDLVVSPQDGPEGLSFVIKDLVAERFFRFKEIEHFIARQFDGTTSPEMVRRRVEERFGVGLSPENLLQFIERLRRLGLVTEGEAAALSPPARKRRRVAGDLFYLRARLFDPDRLFDFLLPKVRFLFTPQFLFFSAGLIGISTVLSGLHWAAMMQQARGLFHFQGLMLAWFVSLVVIGAHEFSHGLTCKFFGGRVREIGFMLIYFQPAFYCNVSDAWLFSKKAHRLWVTFAGAYFEVFLWALAVVTWRITEPSTWPNQLALIVVATSAIKTFFNMNPLIKLDGYYLLSDWLDIPNLRQRAFSYVGTRVKRVWSTTTASVSESTPRQRRIYVAYALLAGGYTYWLLGRIALWFGGYMVARYQGVGFIAFAGTLGFVFRRSLKKCFSPISTRVGNIFERIALSKRVKLGIVLGILLPILFLLEMELKVSGPFTILPLHNADVRAQVEGIIEEVYVDENDFVEKGALIARLADRDFRADLRKTRAETEAKQAQLKLLKAGPRKEDIELARTQRGKAEERVKFSEGHLERDRILFQELLISEQQYEDTREQAVMRKKEMEEAANRLETLIAGTRPEEIEALEADLRRLNAHEHYVKEQMGSLEITSPNAGIVTTHKPKEKIGQHVNKGDLIAEVHEPQTVTVEIEVPEKEIADVHRGQKVLLKARAYPRANFEGVVTSIAPVAVRKAEWQNERTLLVTTLLKNSDGLLKPEMTGNAKIYCGKQPLIQLLNRRFVRFIRVEFWSWW
jgi:putative peptide zinc metalloprotease protein